MDFNISDFLDQLITQANPGVLNATSVIDLPDHMLMDYEERAAILEYDGGLPSWQAEEQATHEIVKRMGLCGNASDKLTDRL
jgi:hypothetical protein